MVIVMASAATAPITATMTVGWPELCGFLAGSFSSKKELMTAPAGSRESPITASAGGCAVESDCPNSRLALSESSDGPESSGAMKSLLSGIDAAGDCGTVGPGTASGTGTGVIGPG